ncbi:hypothetical protein JW826_03695 [Candidatus Woesearchaeota archaeon]|nr:hypothetical protein [Candidatus Woesearchaeota archaeon]
MSDEPKSAKQIAMERADEMLAKSQDDSNHASQSAEEQAAMPAEPIATSLSEDQVKAFDSTSSAIKNRETNNKLDQIAPAIADEYLDHARYTDERKVRRYKTTFTPEETDALGEGILEQFRYHTNLRVFESTPEQYETNKGIKDKQGVSLADTVMKHHFQMDSGFWKRKLKPLAEDGKTIDQAVILSLAEENIEHHLGVITRDILGGIEPDQMDQLKAYVKLLGDRHKLDEKVISRALTTNDFGSLIKQYAQIARQFYTDSKKA